MKWFFVHFNNLKNGRYLEFYRGIGEQERENERKSIADRPTSNGVTHIIKSP